MGVLEELREIGVSRGDLVALVAVPEVGLALATSGRSVARARCVSDALAGVVRDVETALRPRWVMWSNATAITLVEAGVRVATALGHRRGPPAALRRLARRIRHGCGR